MLIYVGKLGLAICLWSTSRYYDKITISYYFCWRFWSQCSQHRYYPPPPPPAIGHRTFGYHVSFNKKMNFINNWAILTTWLFQYGVAGNNVTDITFKFFLLFCITNNFQSPSIIFCFWKHRLKTKSRNFSLFMTIKLTGGWIPLRMKKKHK